MLGGCCGQHACQLPALGSGVFGGAVSLCPAALACPGVGGTAPEESHPRKGSLTPIECLCAPLEHCLHCGDRKGHLSQAVSRSHLHQAVKVF